MRSRRNSPCRTSWSEGRASSSGAEAGYRLGLSLWGVETAGWEDGVNRSSIIQPDILLCSPLSQQDDGELKVYHGAELEYESLKVKTTAGDPLQPPVLSSLWGPARMT